MSFHVAVLVLTVVPMISDFCAADEYIVRNEFAKMDKENKKYVDVKEFKFYKMNRNDAAMNLTYETKFDIMKPKEGKVQVTFYQFRDNEYKKTAISVSMDVCTLLKTGEYGMSNLLFESNVTPCPFLRGTYYIKKMSPRIDTLPMHFPPGKWMLELTFYYLENLLMRIQWMATIEKVIS